MLCEFALLRFGEVWFAVGEVVFAVGKVLFAIDAVTPQAMAAGDPVTVMLYSA